MDKQRDMSQANRILASNAPVHKMSDGTLYKGYANSTWIRIDQKVTNVPHET